MEPIIQPQQTNTLPPNNKNRISTQIIFGIILVFILAVGLGIYLFVKNSGTKESISTTTPINNEVANWKTYRNDKYGFEFKYPLNYYLTAQGELYSENDSKLNIQNEGVDGVSAQWIRVGYSLATSQDVKLAQELKIASIDSDYRKTTENTLEKVIEFNGTKAKLGIYPDYPAEDAYNLNAYFYDSQYNSLFIGLDRVGKTLEEARSSTLDKTLIQILSTFKFTKIAEGTPSIESDLFKKYGFRIDFPESWKNYRMSEGVYGNYSSICFSFERYCVMQVVIYTPEQFNQFVNQYPSKSKSYDYKSEKYYYKFEYIPGCAELSQSECQRTNEVPQIVKTFRFQ